MATPSTEQLEEIGFNAAETIVWDEQETLMPSVDFKQGTVFMTVPVKVNAIEKVGKGKAATEKIVTKDGLALITSDRHSIEFNKENVDALGFAYPAHVTAGGTKRWSTDSIRAFLLNKDEYPEPADVWMSIRKVYEEYIDFENEIHYDIMPLFVMGTYVFRLYRALGYIHFNGTAASGKSQNLRILDALAFNTIWASSMTASSLFRTLAGSPGTVCIDEAEGWDGERGEELRRILNAGYLDGAEVIRTEKVNDTLTVARFPAYGPKVIASINPLDAVIGSRCLVVSMRPAIRRIGEFDKDDPRWGDIRDDLYLFAMYHSEALSSLVTQWNKKTRHARAPELVGRQWQITQLYVTLADYIDPDGSLGLVNSLITYFNEYFAAQQANQDATDRIRLLLKCLPRVLAKVTPHDGSFYPVKSIHEVVSEYLDADQLEYYKTRTITKHLDVLGFKRKRPHKAGVQIWLEAEDIREAFRQRRVETFDEDSAWLAGESSYEHAPPPIPEDKLAFWESVSEDE